MRIGIDISQIVYEGAGVAIYVKKLVAALVALDHKNDYILFGASLRQRQKIINYLNELKTNPQKVKLVILPIPPTILDILWNRLHIFSIERFTGPLDVFWSSDWTQPPLQYARGVTTIHDLSFLQYPAEHDKLISETHKRRLFWVKKECEAIFCDSIATMKDVERLLGIASEKLHLVYPGFTL